MPVLERRRDHADRRTCDDGLAELPGQVLLDRVPVYGLLHARIDTGQNHGLIVSFGREREIRNEGEGSGTNADGADEVPAIERRCKTAAACAGNLMQISHCPSLGDGGTQLILAGIRCRRNGEAVSQGKSTVARADVARQFMSLRPRKAIFGPPAEIRPSASRCDRPA